MPLSPHHRVWIKLCIKWVRGFALQEFQRDASNIEYRICVVKAPSGTGQSGMTLHPAAQATSGDRKTAEMNGIQLGNHPICLIDTQEHAEQKLFSNAVIHETGHALAGARSCDVPMVFEFLALSKFIDGVGQKERTMLQSATRGRLRNMTLKIGENTRYMLFGTDYTRQFKKAYEKITGDPFPSGVQGQSEIEMTVGEGAPPAPPL